MDGSPIPVPLTWRLECWKCSVHCPSLIGRTWTVNTSLAASARWTQLSLKYFTFCGHSSIWEMAKVNGRLGQHAANIIWRLAHHGDDLLMSLGQILCHLVGPLSHRKPRREKSKTCINKRLHRCSFQFSELSSSRNRYYTIHFTTRSHVVEQQKEELVTVDFHRYARNDQGKNCQWHNKQIREQVLSIHACVHNFFGQDWSCTTRSPSAHNFVNIVDKLGLMINNGTHLRSNKKILRRIEQVKILRKFRIRIWWRDFKQDGSTSTAVPCNNL